MVDIVVSQPISIPTAPTPGGGNIEAPTALSSSSLTTAASSTSGGFKSGENEGATATVSFTSSGNADKNTTASTMDNSSEGNAIMSPQENDDAVPSVTTSVTVAVTADGVIEVDTRERGFSLEFFSFGMNEDEPLPPTTLSSQDAIAVKEEDTADGDQNISSSHPLLPPLVPQQSVLQQQKINRPRGDSIIFDPVSFSDGGIHEENALLKTRGVSSDLISLDENEELAIMNSPGFVEATPPPTVSTARPDACTSFRTDDALPSMTSSSTSATSARPPLTTSSASVPSVATMQQKVQQTAVPSPIPAPVVTASDGSPATGATVANNQQQQWVGTTTAAVTNSNVTVTATPDLSNTSTPSPTITHSLTTCPLDLVNKDGRIGIYRPEARKARIAKFHSKRKMRIWRKRIKYDCRKKLADSRPRIKGRFVKRSDEDDDHS